MLKYGACAVLIVIAGCVSMQKMRQQFIQSHSDLTVDQRDAIVRGEIIAGMTEEMTSVSWGQPLDIVQEVINRQKVVSWIYQRSGDDHINTYRVRFVQGKVSDVRLINTQRRVYSTNGRRYWQRYYPEVP